MKCVCAYGACGKSSFYYCTLWSPPEVWKHFSAPGSDLFCALFPQPQNRNPLLHHVGTWGVHTPQWQRPCRWLTWKMAWRNQSHLFAYVVKLARAVEISWSRLSALCSHRQNYKHFTVSFCSSEGKLPHLYVSHFLFLFISRVLACRQQKKNLISFLLYICGIVSKAQNNN